MAQGSGVSISFGYDGISMPDTVSIGDTIEFSCWVINSGEDVLAENILLKAAIYDNILGLTNIRTIGGQGPNFIYPGDSIQFVPGFLFETVTQQNYLPGDNIVVIWPKADMPGSIGQTNQYIYKNIYVKTNSSVSSVQNKNKQNTYFYPQPIQDKIYLTHPIQSLQIVDILGKNIVSFETVTQTVISVGQIPEGIYFARMKDMEGKETTHKLIIKR